jgi:hypothetical protein
MKDIIKALTNIFSSTNSTNIFVSIIVTIIVGLIAIGLIGVISGVLMFVWNNTIACLFTGVNEITFFQSLLLYVFIQLIRYI